MTEMKKPCACDYEACREVWKRVAPGEDPYPMADNANTQMSAQDSELTLPGAEADPCCMGSDASVSVEVLQGFLREELGDAQVYAYLSSCTPRREMARAFRALSEDEKRHARDLAAAIYLITGKAYCPRDGEALNETQFGIENGITFHPYDGYEALVFPQTVPKGCVFVLGDNRTVSRDSRYAEIGMIDTRHIMGEAVFTLYPFDRFGFVKTNENN